MANYVKPQVLVFQEFSIVPTEITAPLRAHISGPHADLHRYSDADEKELINVGAYDYLEDTCYPWPQRVAGSEIDFDYVKLYADDALLMYLEDVIGEDSTVTAVSGRTNWIESDTLSFKSNGVAYPRSSVFLDRDCQIGDVVKLRAVSADEDCEETELTTYIAGFASIAVDSELGDASADAANQADTTASISIEKTGGADNCVTAVVVDPSDYDGLLDGDVEEEYTIEVVKSSVAGCNAARLRITSASGHDDVAEVQPGDWGDETEIGTRGVAVVFDNNGNSSCSAEADEDEVTPTEFVVGQKWKVTVAMDFAVVLAQSLGEYTGDVNDTYIIECTKGGLWADLPEVTVTTTKGLDFSGPTEVTDANTAVPIGSQGVEVLFYGWDDGLAGSSVSLDFTEPVPGLRKGDKWYITVTGIAAGPVRRLILKHNIPAACREASDMDLRLYIKDDIEISENRLGFAPLVNWEAEATQLCVKDGIQAYHASWTDNGIEQALPLREGTLFIHYREWLAALCDQVNAISDVADLDDIAGPLHPDNPLKWGVYKALSNSNGTEVKYTAVCTPAELDSWQDVLARVKGNDELYNFVPLTFRRDIQNLFAAHVDAESTELTDNWKGMFCALQAVTTEAVVSATTSTDEEVVLATISDNPNATGTQYTLLEVPADNAQFITNGVEAGDTVRGLYTIDGFGETSYTEFVVDEVLSEGALVLFTGHSSAISVAQKIEIWHALDKNELADQLATAAGSFGNRRVCAVWPDTIGEAGTNMDGYYLAAALAGLVSGVVPHQGLTNVEIAGFDDVSRTYAYFNSTQLDRMAEAGVWLVTQDRDGHVFTRHGLTTDNLDLNRREEMVRRNVDAISYLFFNRLKPFIGRTNATPTMLERLRYEVDATIKYLKNNGFTDSLGGQLISASIRTIEIHALLKDRITIVLDLTVPAPLNNIEIHLVV